MREYKFRGRSIEPLVGDDQWLYGFGVYVVELADGGKEYLLYTSNGAYQVDPETVGQYTGLQDRNGKEIYEGDLAYAEHGNFVTHYLILWDESKAQYIAKIIKTNSVLTKNASFPLWQYVEDNGKCRFEVIGNRFDNPSLLETK